MVSSVSRSPNATCSLRRSFHARTEEHHAQHVDALAEQAERLDREETDAEEHYRRERRDGGQRQEPA